MAGPFDIFGDDPVSSLPAERLSVAEETRLKELERRVISTEERTRLEALLLDRIKQRKADLEKLLQEMSGHWVYEDSFYRFYHGSFKVYGVQTTTGRAVKLLRELLPERKLNLSFEGIICDGTGKEFQTAHNQDWGRHTRPMLEAFGHAKFMIEMAVRYADLKEPPQPMPSGYAALLYLFDLR
jgi:hypothetical protein